MIGHELTAFYGLDHAESLAVVLPGVWTHQIQRKEAKLVQLGQRLWGASTATATIARTEAFFRALGMPTRLAEYDIKAAEAAAKVQKRFSDRGMLLGEHGDLTPAQAAEILMLRA
jgi:NADP-dependent alcohol dehydrogenase